MKTVLLTLALLTQLSAHAAAPDRLSGSTTATADDANNGALVAALGRSKSTSTPPTKSR